MKSTWHFFCAVLGMLMLSFPAVSAEHPGKGTYQKVCASCHDRGELGAPRMRQTPKWKRLARKGFDGLVGNALFGIRAMPAKGGMASLSDMQVAQAAHYLVTGSGASLPEPTPERVKAARAEGARRAAKGAAAK